MDNAKNIVSSIKDAEQRADEMLKEAIDESQRIVIDAKLDSKEMVYWTQADSQAEARAIVEKADITIASELEKIGKNTQKEKESLENNARSNLPKAVKFITEGFLKLYGDSKT